MGLERGLWKSRNDGWNPGKGPALHLLEVLDGIRDGDKLRHVTLADGEQFRYMRGAGQGVSDAFGPDATVPR